LHNSSDFKKGLTPFSILWYKRPAVDIPAYRKAQWIRFLRTETVLTMEEKTPRAEALAVQFGRIYKVGQTAKIEKLATPETKVIDLKGQTIFPGFIDAHNHFCLYALLTDHADCKPAAGCVRGEDVVEALRAKATNTPPGQWVMGWEYAPYLLDDKKDLTREDFDRTDTHSL